MRKVSKGSNRNAPGGRNKSAKVVFSPKTHKPIAMQNAKHASQGRGMDNKDDSSPAYTPINNEPATNAEVVREQLQKKNGIQMPTPDSRQTRRNNERMRWKAECKEQREADKLNGINGKNAHESFVYTSRSMRRKAKEAGDELL